MKKLMKAGNLCLLTFATTLILTISIVSPIHADATNIEFYVDPAIVSYTSGATLHTRFNVTVLWKDTGDPLTVEFAWQITMYYNSTLLNSTRAWQPSWDPDYIFYGMSTVKPIPSISVDQVQIMDSLYAGSGSGALKKLAIIEFDMMYLPSEGSASSALSINNADSFWSPDGVNWNNPTLTDGTYTVPELSFVVMILALLTTSTIALAMHKNKQQAT